MGIQFEWDEKKAKQNQRKHEVSFDEATTVFSDPLSATIADPLHSYLDEERFVTMGLSARAAPLAPSEEIMKRQSKRKGQPEMLAEYDFSRAQRGKYTQRYKEGTNVVVLDPGVSGIFRTTESVNDALRGLSKIIRRHTRHASR